MGTSHRTPDMFPVTIYPLQAVACQNDTPQYLGSEFIQRNIASFTKRPSQITPNPSSSQTQSNQTQSTMTSSQSQPDHLANTNSTTLGANMPVITLGNGKKVQTGTIGALLVNIKTYDELVASKGGDATETEEKIKELEDRFRAAMPLLKMVGFLDLFTPEEWIAGSRSPGRRRVGELALESES